jgi:thioredoxin reductase (NADPH)
MGQVNGQHEPVAQHDLAIIGAGPIGIELAMSLKRAGVDYIHFDAHQLGYTMTWWPRHTHFFSTTERLALLHAL